MQRTPFQSFFSVSHAREGGRRGVGANKYDTWIQHAPLTYVYKLLSSLNKYKYINESSKKRGKH